LERNAKAADPALTALFAGNVPLNVFLFASQAAASNEYLRPQTAIRKALRLDAHQPQPIMPTWQPNPSIAVNRSSHIVTII
jgi:hypothetical protein